MIKKTMIIMLMLPFSIGQVYASANLNFIEESRKEEINQNVVRIEAQGIVSNDNGTSSPQSVNVFKQGEGIEVVTWTKFALGKPTVATTLDVAKDFEHNNPDFEVIAGVNGDYFAFENSQVISASVLYGNRVLKPDNHSKYSSVEFKLDGSFVAEHKVMFRESRLSLSLYDRKTNALIYFGELKSFNNLNLLENESTIITNGINLDHPDLSNFKIMNINTSNLGSHTFFEGIINNGDINSSTDTFLQTNNPKLKEILANNPKIKVQNEIKEKPHDNLIIGVDTKIINNQAIPTFLDMGGQSPEHNESRHPRTGFGYNQNGDMILITVDGRSATSRGVNLREFAKIMENYGIMDGYNLDGGGSTQAVFRKDGVLQIVNIPSESLRRVANTILFVKRKASVQSSLDIKDDKLTVNVNDQNRAFKEILLYVNEKKYRVLDTLVIDLERFEDYTISLIGVKIDDTEVLLKNEKRFAVEKKPFEKPHIEITHEHLNKKLFIYLNFEDPQRTIKSARVYLQKPRIDLPTLIENNSQRKATFAVDTLENQSIIVKVVFKDNTEKEYFYDIVVASSNKKVLVIATISIGSLLGLGLGAAMLFKKRK